MDTVTRRRALQAMGLGPSWVRRAAADDEAPSPVDRAARIAALAWDELETTVTACTACDLCTSRTQTVFGSGVEGPACLVIGEAPGAEEDAVGEPFVGDSGKLLDAMLAAVGFGRSHNAYIANVLKCRPPGNRDPSSTEMAQCRPYLDRQIALLAPQMILVVGKVASLTLLGAGGSMASLRGREHRITVDGREIPVVATFHPAYLLRSPEEKAKAWADLCLARAVHERIAAVDRQAVAH